MKTLKNLVLALSLLFFAVSGAEAQTSAALDCGSTTAFTASDGTVYGVDTYYTSSTAYTGTAAIAGTTDDALYQTYRANPAFTYSIPMANGTYNVMLKFCENAPYNTAGVRVMNVSLQGTQVLSNFDIYVSAGNAVLTAVDRSFTASVTGGVMTIALSRVSSGSSYACISGIKISALNAPPVANAGSDQSITLPTSSVTLSGSATDSDGTISSYAWTKISGGSATITSPGSASTSVTGLAAGTYVFRLTATDNGGATGTDDVQITVNAANTPPVVNAGSDQSITVPASSVTLSGSATDSDGTISSYAWTKVSGGSATITSPSSASTTVTGLTLGTYVFKLTATDNGSATGNDTVQVTVNGGSTVVTAIECGGTSSYFSATDGATYLADTYVTGGSIISSTLAVTGTSDPTIYRSYRYQTMTYSIPLSNGTYLVTLKFCEMNAANGVGARVFNVLMQGTTVLSNFDVTADPAGGHFVALDKTFSSSVTGGVLTIKTGAVTGSPILNGILVKTDPTSNLPPVANAGGNQSIVLPTSSVTLSGSASDPDGTVASTAWTKTSGPTGGTITSPSSLSTTVTGLTVGTYVFQLTATDNKGTQASSTTQVTVYPFTMPLVAINCGSTSSYTGSTWTSYTGGTGTTYSADTYYSGGTASSTTVSLLGLGYNPGYDRTLYLTSRTGSCTYTIPVPNGTYAVSLQYCETTTGNTVGSRVFNVAIQGSTVLSNFDILAHTPLYTPIYETFKATVSSNTLTIAQTNVTSSATISAIVVRNLQPVPSKIGPGEYHLYYLVNGKLNVIGGNRGGEAGLPYPDVSSAPFPARSPQVPSTTVFTDVGCGGYQTVALDNTGSVWCWGTNIYGEDGINSTDAGYHLPAVVATDNTGATFNNVQAVEGGFHFNAALKNDGTVWVWGLSGDDGAGFDSTGVIGNGAGSVNTNVLRPTKVTFPAGVTITKISAGAKMILALDSTGAVWSWGAGATVSSRGTGNTDPSTPTKLTGLPSGITGIVCGDGTNYAITSSKNLWGWGYVGAWLCIGSGTTTSPQSTPVQINFASINAHVVSVKTSQLTTHVLLDDGTVWGWGSSPRGEVGNGTLANWLLTTPTYCYDYNILDNMVMTPVQVTSNVASLYANPQGGSVYVIKNDGTIWSWGVNKTGFLGNGVAPFGVDNANHPDSWDVPYPAQVQPY